MFDSQAAIIASPVLAIRLVLAGIAREAGLHPIESSLGHDSLEVLACQPAAMLLIHHTDVEIVLRLAQYGLERGLPIFALADHPADVPRLRQAGVTPLSMRMNWSTVADMLRAQLGSPRQRAA